MSVSRDAVNKILLSYPACKVLDCGSGYGRISSFLKESGFDVVGIDNDQGMVDICQNKGIECHKMDAQNLKFENNYFDGCISDGLLEHFIDSSPIIREECRVAKKWVLNFIPKNIFINTILEKFQRVPKEYRRSNNEWYDLHSAIFPYIQIVELSRLFAVRCLK